MNFMMEVITSILIFWQKLLKMKIKSEFFFHQNLKPVQGQLISKENCQAEDSSKKQTNEFVFTSMRLVFVPFLE